MSSCGGPGRIMELASAFYGSSVLFAASDAGIFGYLSRNKGAGASLTAEALNLDVRGTGLVLDACVSLGLLTKSAGGYSNTKETDLYLVPGSPADLSRAIRYNRDVYEAWGHLKELVRTGKPVERPQIHLGEDENRTRDFVLSMHGRASGIGQAVIPQLDLANMRRLLDVGGGPGTYSVMIARRYPEIECTVLDLPPIVDVAEELIMKQDVSDRVKTLAGNYHSIPFPDNNDAVIFFGVLHQESPEAIRHLFMKTFASLRPGGRIFVMDMMTDHTHTAPAFSALFAVNMALTTENGWVFSDEELRMWLKEAGFSDFSCRTLEPPMPHWLATAVKS